MNEEAPIGSIVDTKAVSAKGDAPKKEEVFVGADISMEGFFIGVDVITNALAIATIGDVSSKALTPLLESVPAEEGALIEKKVLEGPGLATEGISAKVSTFPRGSASPTSARAEEAPFATPLVISFGDPFTTFLTWLELGIHWLLPHFPFPLLPPRCLIWSCLLMRDSMRFLKTWMMSPL